MYDRWGRYGRPVVLLHGLFFDRSMWWPVAADLGTACAAIAVDLPGHGQSAPRNDYTLNSIAADLATLIRSLDLHRPPMLVAHAESVLLAAAFARQVPCHAVLGVGIKANLRSEAQAEAGLDAVAAPYRQFAVCHRDDAVAAGYRCWFPSPVRHAVRPPPVSGEDIQPLCGADAFAHLADPCGFAAAIRALL
ncbi:hypothetical protein Aca07nite_71790 [Actinoplanes capillaceus]|uniref:AB hydrolase-1 domain-containing protein n=1 Tax=Actinoplanes campanulatus TaxID=113559 RepID=A0ABQ3WUQ4_9ACTN|nr:hypothetical protein Aca07nite_71790 [Actinoplanes capillaceus]